MAPPVKHAVRTTFATLLLGVFGQRLLQLISFLCIGRALGAERLGIYAQGTAVTALVGVLASAGVRNLLTRAVTHDPNAAANLLLQAVRARLVIGGTLALAGVGAAFALTDAPWFWTLCLLQAVPGAFDLKNLLDAAGRTRAEVMLETVTALLQLLLVLGWLATGGHDLVELAAIGLGARGVYAMLALPTIRRIPAVSGEAPTTLALPRLRTGFAVAAAEALHGLLTAGDIWFVALCFGNGAAGYYAVATRFAGAALLPSTQLARLLLPHLLHAGASGDARRTLATASRATLLVTLPMLAGGAATAERLCTLPGAAFAAAAPALVLALLSGCLQHSGWQQSHALLAAGRFGAYARGLAVPALLHLGLLVTGAALAQHGELDLGDPTTAMVGAGIAVLANAWYFLGGAQAVRDLRPGQDVPIGGAVRVAVATGTAAALPAICGEGRLVLPLQLLAGGLAFAGGLWLVELRGRLGRLGDGLAQASGFHV